MVIAAASLIIEFITATADKALPPEGGCGERMVRDSWGMTEAARSCARRVTVRLAGAGLPLDRFAVGLKSLKRQLGCRTPKLFFGQAGMRGVAGFGMFGAPVFGREGYAPEGRARGQEFQAYFGFAVAHGAQKHHVAFFFFFG